jgi:hypothetical protein
MPERAWLLILSLVGIALCVLNCILEFFESHGAQGQQEGAAAGAGLPGGQELGRGAGGSQV